MAKFEIYKSPKSGEYYFRLKSGNGQIILKSEGYAAKASCLSGVESVKKNGLEEARYERETAKNGEFFFRLKATNGQVIGISAMYKSKSGRDNGVESIKRDVLSATVEEVEA